MHCHTYYTTYAELSMAMVAKSLSMFPNGRVDHFVAGAGLRAAAHSGPTAVGRCEPLDLARTGLAPFARPVVSGPAGAAASPPPTRGDLGAGGAFARHGFVGQFALVVLPGRHSFSLRSAGAL